MEKFGRLGRVWSLAILVGLGLGLAGAEGEFLSYTHKTEGFTVQYPSDWEAREDVTFQVYKIPFLAVRPLKGENDTFRENMNVVVEAVSLGMSPQTYLNANLKSMKSMLQNFKAVNSADLKGATMPGKYLVYTHVSSGATMKAVVFLFVKGKKGITLTCTSTPEHFDSYVKLFLRLGRAFKP